MSSRKRPRRPEGAYESVVADLWPQLGDEDPRQYDLDKAYQEVVTCWRLNLQTGEWEKADSGARPLLRITCEPELHHAGAAPMLAEIWRTSRGLLYASRLIGAVFDAADEPSDPFAPPAAVSPRARRSSVPTASQGEQWQPVPVAVGTRRS